MKNKKKDIYEKKDTNGNNLCQIIINNNNANDQSIQLLLDYLNKNEENINSLSSLCAGVPESK